MSGSDIVVLELDGAEVPLRIRKHPRARRLILRVDPGGGISLVLPRAASIAEGLRFAEEKTVWIRTHLAALPPRVPFAHGSVLPLIGRSHLVRHRPEARGGVWREQDEIHVAGGADHVSRRLRDWLKAEAKRELGTRAREKAARIGRSVARISVRETRSRWGSCTSNGNLGFSWRLIFAPEPVFDYVVAHEVAHLAEMNHSPDFWAVVDRLTHNAKSARAWLRRHGERLHRYG